ncbi:MULTISPECIES: roadblock/LC7 domain-containing protein [Rhodococcus]|jgi:predicted regulator of Ras-like GTPase activity (Roadblock/LC7/MglB family)|uniref:Roadblock/LC7 domain-containing protein n=1 Tax=Rhodococcus jostii TaxID=132919 RepID=A0ABU4CDY8_RHOJO|nr:MULTISPECIES: roadblock/LC7 domain-containing protein [Rhodococcus]MDI9948019.1 roadblock/LC7 domain-containing protein [Rhodococcus sp. IEGM 1305]MDV6281761.1 roadblock/LC7 domain-containing protein [Rhodococcus jostii]
MHPAPDRALDWLVSNFVRDVPRVVHAVLVSTDGLLMAANDRLPDARATQLAAVAAGLASPAAGAADLFDRGMVAQSVVEMPNGYLLLMSVGDGSQLAVLAVADCDSRQVGYEMALLVERTVPEIQALPRSRPEALQSNY